MTRLHEVKGKTLSGTGKGAYCRCFGNAATAHVLSRVQSLIIMNGCDLERRNTELTSDQHVTDLDDFLSRQIMPTGTMIVTKRVIKSSDIMQGHGIEPDFKVFQHIGSSQMCNVYKFQRI